MKLFIGIAILLVSIIGIDALNKAKDCKCRINTQNRVINGRAVPKSSYPWYATIEFPIHEDLFMLNCAATILSEDTLLLAGHCMPPHRNNTMSRENLDRYRVVIRGSGESIGIKEFHYHPHVNLKPEFKSENDIGIIKLNKTITFNRFVQPACLDTQKTDKYSGELKIAGYGHQTVIYLFHFYNDIQIHYDPSIKYKFSEAKVYDRTEQLCADEKDEKICVDNDKKLKGKEKQGLCFGDQGSGLHMTRNGKTYIIGINTLPRSKMVADSLREFCTTGSYATRLSTYKEFLDKYAGDYCE